MLEIIQDALFLIQKYFTLSALKVSRLNEILKYVLKIKYIKRIDYFHHKELPQNRIHNC